MVLVGALVGCSISCLLAHPLVENLRGLTENGKMQEQHAPLFAGQQLRLSRPNAWTAVLSLYVSRVSAYQAPSRCLPPQKAVSRSLSSSLQDVWQGSFILEGIALQEALHFLSPKAVVIHGPLRTPRTYAWMMCTICLDAHWLWKHHFARLSFHLRSAERTCGLFKSVLTLNGFVQAPVIDKLSFLVWGS